MQEKLALKMCRNICYATRSVGTLYWEIFIDFKSARAKLIAVSKPTVLLPIFHSLLKIGAF